MDSERRLPDHVAQAPLLSRIMSLAAKRLRASLCVRSCGLGRRALGFALLLVTVFLWTACNFLSSLIFSDQTYNKPFFLVYVNAVVFATSMVPRFAGYLSQNGLRGLRRDVQKEWHEWRRRRQGHTGMGDDEAPLAHEGRRVTYEVASPSEDGPGPEDKLTLSETAVLSFEFCLLWSSANYFSSACLEYTSVASATILTSTSSVSTLVFCALFGVEPFSFRRLMGVAASLIGIVLISTVDMTGHSDDQRGSFPEKTAGEIALGDFMALLSAIIYGLYITIMKMRVGNEDRVDMQLFFGLAGVFNVVFLWPVFFVLDWMDIEKMGLPPTGLVWTVIISSALASFVSDYTWAYAMLLTTPLVVTVGLSLTIPLSLVGEIFQYGQYSSPLYWVGAATVLLSFVFVSNESQDAKTPESRLLDPDEE